MVPGLGLNAQHFGRVRKAKAGCNPERSCANPSNRSMTFL